MKTIQLILRIITCPMVFIGVGFSMMFFPSPLMFIIGIGLLLGKILGSPIDEDWEEILFLIFGFIIVPLRSAESWITEGTIK